MTGPAQASRPYVAPRALTPALREFCTSGQLPTHIRTFHWTCPRNQALLPALGE